MQAVPGSGSDREEVGPGNRSIPASSMSVAVAVAVAAGRERFLASASKRRQSRERTRVLGPWRQPGPREKGRG